jgi:hypothetical protein
MERMTDVRRLMTDEAAGAGEGSAEPEDVSAELILGRLENGYGGAAGPVFERGLVGGGGEIVDEGRAVAVVDAAGEEVVAKPVGDAARGRG